MSASLKISIFLSSNPADMLDLRGSSVWLKRIFVGQGFSLANQGKKQT